MARLVIHDLTTQYPRIDQMLANLPNAFFSGFDQARERQLRSELGDLTKQKTQLELSKLNQDIQAQSAAEQAWQSIMGGGQQPSLGSLSGAASGPSYNASGRAPTFASLSPSVDFGNAIAGIESSGRYDALGPVTKTGDRAYGKYQVMGANIPEWTRKYVGRAMSPQEFLASPEAQEAVFKGEFGRLAQKYGPEGAARAWFAGEGGMNDPNRRDILGTSVADYSRKFTTALGGEGGQRAQVAQADIPMAGGTPVQGFAVPEASQPFTIFPGASTERLIQIRGMRGLNDQQRSLIDMALKERLDRQNADKPTDDIREYQFYVRQATAAGQQPADFTTWMRDNKKAGAMTVDMTGEREETKAFGKAAGEAAAETMKAAGAASQKLAQLDLAEKRLDQVEQGRLVPGKMKLTALAKALGLNDEFLKRIGLNPDQLADQQAFEALRGSMMVEMIGSGGFPANNFSDADREFLLGTLMSLANDPRANKLIIEAARRVEKLKIEKARAFRDWKKENKDGSFFDFETDWIARMQQQDVFGDLRREAEALGGAGAQQAGGGGGQSRPVPVRTEEDFRLLPPGTVFIAPDGTVRRKP
ncbi:MAG TPA: hypothetical protein VIK69_02380 [Methylophilaceae bacterium]